MNGIFLIDKPAGITSFGVVSKLRKAIGQKKIGHSGTLDPEATGLLLVMAGSATKILPFIGGASKEYLAEFRMGCSSDTYDIWGKLEEQPIAELPDRPQISAALASFIGTQQQVPPVYSAIKMNGRKLYEYARNDVPVKIKARSVTISEIALLGYERNTVKVRVSCSSGTYIRSLAHDFGDKLGIPTVMSALRRTKIGKFTLAEATALDDAVKDPSRLRAYTAYELLQDYPYINYPDKAAVRCGKAVALEGHREPLVMMTEGQKVIAAYQIREDGRYHCLRGLE